jgi:hypothetical protein
MLSNPIIDSGCVRAKSKVESRKPEIWDSEVPLRFIQGNK